MTKSLKIFLAVLALISIGFSLAFYFKWGPFAKKEVGPKPTPAPSAEKAPIDLVGYPELKEIAVDGKNTLFFLPVDEVYFGKAVLNQENPQSLSFFLDTGASVKAIFKGKVRTVFKDQKDFSYRIVIDKEDGEFSVGYIIFGESLVAESDIIEQGQEIAKSVEQKTDFYPITNLTLWIRNKDNNLIKLSRDLFKKE